MLLTNQIRRRFIEYFVQKGHRSTPSSAVIPHDDPTLLFTNAGMNQFKDYFLGRKMPSNLRAVSSQKCIRVGGKHNDLENVGHTTRHLTFFEMLGNFSFGDYFKQEAIDFAWEVTTQIFEFDIDKLWASVYVDDDEAYEYWKKHLPAERIVRIATDDNFWSMGEVGLCGPCSELFYDKGKKFGDAPSPDKDTAGERFFEFWNLVFMQYDRDVEGVLHNLPKPCVDTGAGLERIIALKMGVDNVFETDLLRGLIKECEAYFDLNYEEQNEEHKAAFHVIVDHLRSLSFAIADGVQPSNVDRGYVLRKVLRRAVRYGRLLGAKKPFLGEFVPKLVEYMGDDFPELVQSKKRIIEIFQVEEDAFFKTLKRGGNLLGSVIKKAQASSNKQIPGEDAFKLKDTYGLPLEEIQLVASDLKLSIDLEQYAHLEKQAKELSRQASSSNAQQVAETIFPNFIKEKGKTQFCGYQKTQCMAKVTGLLKEGKWVEQITEKDQAHIFLDQTPFYAEMGGQTGDQGTLESMQGGHFKVTDTQSPYTDLTAHIGLVEKGTLKLGDALEAKVNVQRRDLIAQNHTATHLLHWALVQTLGPHVKQAGSLVQSTRLRFDFSHHKALSKSDLDQIEDLVNQQIRANEEVHINEQSYEHVQKDPDIKQFFGDKYGDQVRVVAAGACKELCGGIHTSKTGNIGLFKILKESSIAAGVRRIEALTGHEAELFVRQKEELLEKMSTELKTTPSQVLDKLSQFLLDHKKIVEHNKHLEKAQNAQQIDKLLKHKQTIGEYHLIQSEVQVPSKDLREFALQVSQNLTKTLVILSSVESGKVALVVSLSKDLKGALQAKDILKPLLEPIEGKGGGKDLFAQAGGSNPKGLEKVFEISQQIVASL